MGGEILGYHFAPKRGDKFDEAYIEQQRIKITDRDNELDEIYGPLNSDTYFQPSGYDRDEELRKLRMQGDAREYATTDEVLNNYAEMLETEEKSI